MLKFNARLAREFPNGIRVIDLSDRAASPNDAARSRKEPSATIDDTKTCAFVAKDGAVEVWDVQARELQHRLSLPATHYVTDLRFSQDGDWLEFKASHFDVFQPMCHFGPEPFRTNPPEREPLPEIPIVKPADSGDIQPPPADTIEVKQAPSAVTIRWMAGLLLVVSSLVLCIVRRTVSCIAVSTVETRRDARRSENKAFRRQTTVKR